MLSELQILRKKNLDLSESLANETDHNKLLESRLKNVKEKYQYVK